MTAGALRLHPDDTVAVVLAEAGPGGLEVRDGSGVLPINLRQTVAAGHKVALVAHAPGSPVVKYGHRIGHATRAIAPGDWVHLHNCASDFDERSNTLDPLTGLPSQ